MIASSRLQRGFALLIVLWTLGLLAVFGNSLIAAARERTALTRDMRDAATLREAADGATQHAIFEILNKSNSRWLPDGADHTVRIGASIVTIRIRNEADKVNPNAASAADLLAAIERASVDPRTASILAAAIIAWRVPGSGQSGGTFTRLDDLARVPGMTPELLAALRPYLTLYTGTDPDEAAADPTGAIQVVSIFATALGPDKSMFASRAIVRTNARRSGSRYEILLSEHM